MKLSRKTDYALRALMTLVGRYGGGPLSLRVLAAENDIPKRFLEHIMLDMKDKGWVRGYAGRDGGYELAVSPTALTMGQVVRFFDGVLAPIGCVSVSQHQPCTQENHCRFRRIMLDIRNYTARRMDQATLAQVYAQAPVSRADVFASEFVDGGGI